MSSRERTRAALLLVAVFVVGALIGAAVDRMILFRGGRMYPKHAVHATSGRMAAKLDRELNLSDEQEAKVREIMDRRSARLDAVWMRVEPAMRQEIDRADSEISAILDPKQRARFDALKKRWRDRARRALGK